MENLIMKSFLDYPEHIEDFLEDISVKSFTPFNQKLIKVLVGMNHKNQTPRLETIKLRIGEKEFESEEFKRILAADSYPDYLNLKSDFKTYLCFQMQEYLANKLKEATRKSEVFDYEFLNKYINLGIVRNGRYFWEWEEHFKNKPPIEKIETGINFLDAITDGGIELGQIVLLSGDPEAGKTLLGVQCLMHAHQQHKVTYFGFEFSVRKHIETLKDKNFKIKGDHYFIDDQSCELNDLISQIRSLSKEGHKVFLIDSQMKIQAPVIGRTIEEIETSKFSALSECARNLQVLIIFIIQNSKNDSYTPTGSRKGGHEAHLMIRIERLKKYQLPEIKDFNERAKHRRVLNHKDAKERLAQKTYPKRLKTLLHTLAPKGVEFRKLGEVLEYDQPNKYCVTSKEFDKSYPTPVLTAGKTFILGYTNEKDNIYQASKNAPVIIFDDFTTATQWVDFPFKVKSSAMKILLPKNPTINIRFIFFYMQTIPYNIGGEHARHWISRYSQLEVPIPPLEIQQEIVKILDQFSILTTDLLAGIPAEIKARKKQYEYYREKLLTFKPLTPNKEVKA